MFVFGFLGRSISCLHLQYLHLFIFFCALFHAFIISHLCDLLATVTFFSLISLLQSTPNTAAKVIYLVHHSDHVKSFLSPSGGLLSHYITRSNFSSAISRLCRSLPYRTTGLSPCSFFAQIQSCLLCVSTSHAWLPISSLKTGFGA